MKKTLCALLIGCVSTGAFAQSVTPTDKIIETIEYSIMSKDVEYTSKPSVRTIPKGFMVTVPSGSVKNAAKTPVAEFTFPMIEDGKLGNDVRYKVQLNKISEIFPSLEKIINSSNVTYALLSYVGNFVPAKGLVEKQVLTIENLNMPIAQMGSNASADSIVFTDSSDLLADGKIKQENKLLLKNVKLTHPMANATIQSVTLDVLIPEAQKASSPLEQIIKTSSAKQTLRLDAFSLNSALAGSASVSFNLNQSFEAKQNQVNQNLDFLLSAQISDFKMTGKEDLPTNLTLDANVSGFTIAEYLNYLTAMEKLSENEQLPDSPRKEIILKTVQSEVDKAYNELTDNMRLQINDIGIKANQYALQLKGSASVKDQKFNGSLQVTNFDYLAPQPKVIDEAACQAVVDKMLNGELAGESFQAQYNTTCEDGAGVLDALRPYASTAKKVKDSQGKDALLFDIQVHDETLFINGQKVDENAYANPMELLN